MPNDRLQQQCLHTQYQESPDQCKQASQPNCTAQGSKPVQKRFTNPIFFKYLAFGALHAHLLFNS